MSLGGAGLGSVIRGREVMCWKYVGERQNLA